MHLPHLMHSGEEGSRLISIPMGQTLLQAPHPVHEDETPIPKRETLPARPQMAPSGQRYRQKGLHTDMDSRMTARAMADFQ